MHIEKCFNTCANKYFKMPIYIKCVFSFSYIYCGNDPQCIDGCKPRLFVVHDHRAYVHRHRERGAMFISVFYRFMRATTITQYAYLNAFGGDLCCALRRWPSAHILNGVFSCCCCCCTYCLHAQRNFYVYYTHLKFCIHWAFLWNLSVAVVSLLLKCGISQFQNYFVCIIL